MKILLSLFITVLLVSCEAQNGSSVVTNTNGPANTWSNRVDTNVQAISFDIVNGGSTYYSSLTNIADSTAFTIPEYVDIDNDSLGTIHGDDYVELQIANRTFCKYNKVTNYFQFYGCTTADTTINWTIKANDVYYMSDLNAQATNVDKNKVIFVLKRNSNCVGACNINGHIGFSYDL